MEITSALNSSYLQLMLLLTLIVSFGWLLGRYLIWLYRDAVLPNWLNLVEEAAGYLFRIDLDDQRILVPWLKICAFSLIIGLAALMICEWVSFRQIGIDGIKALKIMPWQYLINTAFSYLTNTGWNNGYHAMLENYFGQISCLIPINIIGAALWISLAVILIKALFDQEKTQLGSFNRYFIRTIIALLVPLWALTSLVLMPLTDKGEKTAHLKIIAPATLNYATLALKHPTKPLASARAKTLVKANRWRKMLEIKTKFTASSAAKEASKPVSSAKWAIYQAANLVTANGRTTLYDLANAKRPLNHAIRTSLLAAILIVLVLPTSFIFLVNFYTPDKKTGRTILILMLILFSVQFIAIAFSELKASAVRQLGTLNWLSLATSTATSLGDFTNLLASSTLSTQFISMISLILGNLIWGSSGLGLITMLFYLSLTEVWTELMIAKNASFSYQALKLRGTLYLTALLSGAGFVAMAFTLPHLRLLPSTTHSLSKLMPLFFYYLSMLQGNGAVLPFKLDDLSLNLGSLSMLIGFLANSFMTIFLIKRFTLAPPRTKRLNLVAESPLRALYLMLFIIVLNGLNIAPILLLAPIFW